MRRMYVLASMLLFMGSVFAQQKNSNLENPKSFPDKANDSGIKNAKEAPNGSTANRAPEDIIFTEDFANGLDGNNELGEPWSVGGADGSLWQHDFDGSNGKFAGTSGPIESETAENGFMIIDCDLYNTGPNNETIQEDVNGWVQTPELDMTDLGSVLVDYSSYFRYCCWPGTPVFIGVSIDDGVTWTNFKPWGYGQFIEQANNNSGTLNVTTDISSVAANQSSVLIRFAYMASETDQASGYSHYYFQVDDVVVYENPNANNLAVLQVMNGDVDNLWEIKNTPLEQNSPLLLGAVYGNYGSATQTGVSITWDVMLGDDVLHTNTVDIGEVTTTRLDGTGSEVQNIDTAWVESGYTLPGTGNYTIRTTITGNEEEEVPESSVWDKDIKITIAVMSHDDLNLLDLQVGPAETDEDSLVFQEVGFGTQYFVFNPGSMAYGVQVVFGGNTTPGTEAVIEFYEVDPDLGLNATGDNMPTDVPLTENEFIVTEADTGINIFIPFLDPIALEVGKNYFAAVRQYEGEEELWVRATEDTDTDNSSYVRSRGGTEPMVWFSRPDELAVRLGFSETTEINEVAKLDLNLFVAPNPANDYTTVSYELKEANNVSYKLYDVNGRTIVSEELGSQASGVYKINVNTSSYDTGVYYLIMTVGDSTVTEKIVITK